MKRDLLSPFLILAIALTVPGLHAAEKPSTTAPDKTAAPERIRMGERGVILPTRLFTPAFDAPKRLRFLALAHAKAEEDSLTRHRAVIAGDWKIAADWGRPWQMFNLAQDRTELHNLSINEPERFKQMTALWDKWWADKNPGLFKPSGAEPTYRRLADNDEVSQGGNDEADQAGAAKKKRKKQK